MKKINKKVSYILTLSEDELRFVADCLDSSTFFEGEEGKQDLKLHKSIMDKIIDVRQAIRG